MIKRVKLGDIAEITVGYVGIMKSEYVSSGIPFFRSLNVNPYSIDESDLLYISEEFSEKIRKSELHEDDLVIVRTGKPGTCSRVPPKFDGANCSDLVIVRPDKNKVDVAYLEAYINHFAQKQISNQKVGAVQQHFNITAAKEMVLYLPELSAQKRIGSIVQTLNNKIANNNAINAELEALAKTIYDYWFLQFEFPNEEGLPYKSSGGRMVWSEELKREIPEGWGVSSLRGKITLEKGLSYTSKDIESGDGVPMINLACIDRNRDYRDGELKFHSGKIPKKAYLESGDLLIACTDLTRNADIVGSPILVPDDDNIYTYSTDISKLIPSNEHFNKYYLYMTLRTDFYHNYIKKWASGTNVLHLNVDGINWYTTWIPPMNLQNRYANIIKAVHKQKSKTLKENRELAALRDWLLPMLMNGQVGFKDTK